MSYILVTGANGFVGHILCEELIKHGHIVRAACRAQGGSVIESDVVTISNIDNDTDWTVALSNVATVIHLAARVHVMNDTSADPLNEFLKLNLHGTVNLAQQAAKAGVKRFVYVSSIKVNGEFTVEDHSFTEVDTPHPHDPYAISKYQAEQALQVIAKDTGMEIVIVRPPLIYGPGVKANFLNLIRLINKSLPLPLGSIQNARSMIYVGNLVSALIVCATHPNAKNQIYCVSDGHAISTPQLIALLAKALNRRNNTFKFPPFLILWMAKLLGKTSTTQRLMQSLVIDSGKISNDLGWKAPYTIADGMKITADWFNQKS